MKHVSKAALGDVNWVMVLMEGDRGEHCLLKKAYVFEECAHSELLIQAQSSVLRVKGGRTPRGCQYKTTHDKC